MKRQTNINEAKLKERIKELEKHLAHYTDNCTVVWMPEDVECAARDGNYQRPSIEDCSYILERMEHKHDATLGISWDTLYYWCGEVLEDLPDTYYEKLDCDEWGDHPLNNREVEYNE